MNLFELFFKIGVKDEASREVAKLSKGLGDGLKKAAKVGLSAVSLASAAVVALTKQSLESYAEYEQLIGGVETLFGAGGKTLEEYSASVGKTTADAAEEYAARIRSQEQVIKNADEAFKTAGLSANEYISTVTSFSASLLQSLDGDTETAAELANQALIDMSDNANKMGTDMSMIQNAYQGFAKQNYTMLDNLKLGYGGTRTEMKRLVKDAAALDDSIDSSSLSFANVVRAIKVVQDEMGITGTTYKEAGTTIQGSVNMVKAAWKNLTTALADDDGDVEGAAERLIDSLGVASDNILPRIRVILKSIPKVLKEVGPMVIKELPGLVREISPDAAEAVADLVVAAIEVIPSLGYEVVKAIDKVLEDVGDELSTRFPAFSWLFEDLEDKVWAVVAAIVAFKTIKGVADFINTASKAMDILTMRTKAQTAAQTNLNTATVNYSNILKKLSNSKIFSWMMGRGASGGATPMGSGGGLPSVYTGGAGGAGAAGAAGASLGMLEGGAVLFGAYALYDSYKKQEETGLPYLDALLSNDPRKTQEVLDGIQAEANKDITTSLDSLFFDRMKHGYANGLIDEESLEEIVRKNTVKYNQKKLLEKLLDGSHRTGLERVPFDGYIAELHEGERVLTKKEAENYSPSKKASTNVTVNVNIDGAKYDDEETLAEAVARRLQRLFDEEDAVFA